ncbi:MAG: cytochrome c-type biogenesis protein [Gammaproteobacteria bacterium]
MRRRFAIALLLFCASALASANPEQEARVKALSESLRCLVCQNQSIAESNADLAQDLRGQVERMVQSGATDDEIIGYMVERYGDFVLYKPPVKPSTYLLWAGPFLLLLAGMAVFVRVLARRNRAAADAPLSDEERHRLEALLQEDAEGERR